MTTGHRGGTNSSGIKKKGLSFWHEASAAHLRSERIRAIRNEEDLPKKKNFLTLGDVWKRYEEWSQTENKHQRQDEARWRNHIAPKFAGTLLKQTTPAQLETFKLELRQKGLSEATVKHCLVLIRQMINKAKNWNLWEGENPVSKVKLPKLNNGCERFLTREEASKLLEALAKSSQQLHDIALLSLFTGMRAGEVFNDGIKEGVTKLTSIRFAIRSPVG